LSAPAKNTRTVNKFESLGEQDDEPQKKEHFMRGKFSTAEPTPVQEKPAEPKTESKGPPRFTGFKSLLSKQNELNADSNKNLPELQEKLREQIKIHDAKPPPRVEGQEDGKERKPYVPYEKTEHKPYVPHEKTEQTRRIEPEA